MLLLLKGHLSLSNVPAIMRTYEIIFWCWMSADTTEKKVTRAPRRRTPAYVKSLRGVKNWKQATEWLAWRDIEDIECITPDQAGVARGKMMPSKKFTSNTSLALPSAVFMTTISGDYPEDGHGFQYPEDDGDLRLLPDLSTLSAVPWESDATAQVICDLVYQDGRAVEFTPRNVLRSVVAAYNKRGHSIAGVNEFDELIDDIYHFSEGQGLEIDTLIHEEGAAQLEINLRHGDPVELADQVFLFKRTIREAALKHDMYATFMAKPIQGQPGSAMHIHQSIVDKKTGRNIFSNEDGSESEAFRHFIGGMQRHVPNALVMFAPYVNSYRRLTPSASAPVNVKWGYDNRTTAFRVPRSEPGGRRVENRIPSSDANPYLALAASLACGLIGLVNKIEADQPASTSVNTKEIDLPRGLIDAVELFENDQELRNLFGNSFVTTYAAIKRAEFETFMEVISPWEREFLLLNV
jgi:glutamine synthetase